MAMRTRKKTISIATNYLGNAKPKNENLGDKVRKKMLELKVSTKNLRNSKPERVWGWAIALTLLFLVFVPVIYMVYGSFTFDENGPRMVQGVAEGDFTLFNWVRTVGSDLSKSIFYEPALNSLEIAIGMTAVALILGSLFAWLVVRSDVPFKGFFTSVMIIPYIVPSWTVGMAWLTVFKSAKYGGSPGLLSHFFGIDAPDWIIYGYIPIVVSLGVHYVPYFFIMMRGALSNIDSRLEESAELLQASNFEILIKVTLPMILPAIGAGFILTFSKGLGEFGTQAFLGLPIRYYTFSTRIYSALNNQLYGEGYVLAIILIITTTSIVILNQKVLGTRKRYVTIGGKGSRKKPIKLGKWKIPFTVLLFTFVIIFVFAPLILLGIQTFLKYEGVYTLKNLTLHYWIGGSDPNFADGQPGIFRNPTILGALKNSLFLSSTSAVIGGVIGILIGYTVVKGRKTFLAKFIENLTFAPYLIPGVAFGGIFLTMFAKSWGPFPSLYGTFTIIIIICVVKHLPYSSSAGITAMHQIDPSLEEVAVVHGIGWVMRFRKIIFPLTKNGMLSGMLLNFITTMRTLDLVILLVTPKTTLLTSVLYRYQSQDYVQHAYGIMMMIIVIVISGHLIMVKAGGKIEL